MTTPTFVHTKESAIQIESTWLMIYYLARAAVSFVWFLTAVTLGSAVPVVSVILLIFYPAWDALANLLDALRNGGLRRNPFQALNAVTSLITTLAIAIALEAGMTTVLAVFGLWAVASGLMQLVTAVRRWRFFGAQWVMILSGGQSALAGGFFIKQSLTPGIHGITEIAPYVAFGAFYFLVSGIWLVVRRVKRLNY